MQLNSVRKGGRIREDNRDRFYIELYINTWLLGSNSLFEYNVTMLQQYDKFCAFRYQLDLPKPQIPVYYFLHQYQGASKVIYLQKRKKMLSKFELKNKQINQFKLIGALELTLTLQNESYHIIMRPYKPNGNMVDFFLNKEQEIDNSPPYVVVRTLDSGYHLQKGQIIKMGKICLLIRQIYTKNMKRQHQQEDSGVLNLDNLVEQSRIQKNSEIQLTKHQCRYCSGHLDTQDDPLINPCDCKGTSKYVHIECVKQWVNLKLRKLRQAQNGSSYHEDQLFCEICQKKLPRIVKKNGREFTMLTFLQEDMEFIAFTPLSEDTLQPLNGPDNSVYVMVNQEKQARIGRLDNNGMILSDTSVSRQHAVIQLIEDTGFVIKDRNSKFGTLVYDTNAQIDFTYRMRAIQIGQTVFAFSLHQKNAQDELI